METNYNKNMLPRAINENMDDEGRYYYTSTYVTYQIKTIFAGLNIHNISISVNHNSKDIASVTGINFNDYLNMPSFVNLNLNFDRIKNFNPDELLFIIAHACGHVYHNHMIGDMARVFLESIVKGKEYLYGQIVNSIKNVYPIVDKLAFNEFHPKDAAYIKHIELEADKFAITKITHDVDSAVRCLKHLCNNHTERESHVWELSKVPFNIMTMSERIQMLMGHVG
jgi:hypothetical protein